MPSGKIIAITGASGGLGRELALQLAQRGARLALFARNEAALHETSRLCRQPGAPEPLVVVGDVTKPEDCARFIGETVARFGALDGLIANAGVSMWAQFEEVRDLSLFRKLIEVNYLGAVHCLHPALPHLRSSRGQFIAIASLQSKIGAPAHTGYTAAKHALDGFIESLRMELDGSGIHILAVYPSWISGTELRGHAFCEAGQKVGEGRRNHTRDATPVGICAEKILAAMAARREQLFIPGKYRWLAWARLALPHLLRRSIQKRVATQKQGD
jgi:NAD(P)-dependent dehydrogenase (short-subunit alcohol dehydrogenase family)